MNLKTFFLLNKATFLTSVYIINSKQIKELSDEKIAK